MALDAELIQQLHTVFEVELEEQTQLMTTGLLALEKVESDKYHTHLKDILRSAHTIKGAAKGIGQDDIVTVIHLFESILSKLEKGALKQSTDLLNLLLVALDSIHAIFHSQRDQKTLCFDLSELVSKLEDSLKGEIVKSDSISIKETEVNKPTPSLQTNKQTQAIEPNQENQKQSSTYSVSAESIMNLSVVTEDLQTTHLQIKQLLTDIQHLSINLASLNSDFNEVLISQSSTDNSKVSALISELSQLSHHATNLYNEKRPFVSQFSQLIHTLDQSVNTLRLVPFSTVLLPLHRVIRDLSQQQNKQVDFIIEGDDIKIDRYLYKALHTPLVHLITNAIDHGIEPFEKRQESNKPPQAQLKLKITKQGNTLLISINDDGRGIDHTLIKQIAIKKLLITESEATDLTEQQLLNLIFKAGFSTSEIISTTSGRGVGLDIVRNNLRKIKGSIEVFSTLGRGSRFTLTLPAMLSSEQGLIISIAEQKFAIPAFTIDWVKEFHSNTLRMINEQVMLSDKHGQPISCFYLSELLGLQNEPKANAQLLPTLFISNGETKIAVFVDLVIGDQDLIIKPFSYPLTKVPFSVGMATLANGQLIPVLDVDELIDRAMSVKTSAKQIISENEQEQNHQRKILIVDDSVTTRTLELNILQRQGFHVTALINGQEAWQELQKNNNYDLIITDVEMPLLNGFELVKKIKTSEELKDIPTIIVTSLNSNEDKKRGVQVGANAYISKDMLNTDSLLNLINQLI